MAIYKIPQDVEADDKLLGPFTFRQFIYLIVDALSIGVAWALAQISIPLAILPLPVIIFFGALALPLRKDQPMEAYLGAMISFMLKPHNRLWDPDGIESLIEITVPKVPEVIRTKDITQTEVQRRFSYLAEIADSQGWSIRGSGVQAPNSSMNSDIYFEAEQVRDVLADDETIAQNLNRKLDQSNAQRHKDMVDIMQSQPVLQIQTPEETHFDYFTNAKVAKMDERVDEPIIDLGLRQDANPQDENIEQAVIRQVSGAAAEPAKFTSAKPASTGIINLANNSDLSVEAIAREANRITANDNSLNEEVVISLR